MYVFWEQNKLLSLRLFTLLSGFGVNLTCVNFILHHHGENDFVIFSFISSLPALLNFLDFGLGTAAYNSQVDSKEKSQSRDFNEQEELTLIYLLSTLLTSICLLLIFFTFFLNPNLFNIGIFTNDNQIYLLLLAFVIVCITSPFSIAYKILVAKHKSSQVIAIQGLIPLFTFLIVVLGYSLEWRWIAFLASPISMLLAAFWAYFSSNQIRILLINNLPGKIRKAFIKLIRHSILSVIAIVMTNIVAFLPRYILAQKGNEIELAKLSFMLMFLISAQSLISVEAQANVTKIRMSKESSTSVLIRQATYRCLILASILSGGMFILSLIDNYLGIRIISGVEAACASLLLFIWGAQTVTSSANSQTQNIKFFIVLYSLILSTVALSWYFFSINSFFQVFLIILLPTYLLVTFGVLTKFKFSILK